MQLQNPRRSIEVFGNDSSFLRTANKSFHLEQNRTSHLWVTLNTWASELQGDFEKSPHAHLNIQRWENLLLWTRRLSPCCSSLHPGSSPHQGRAGSHRSTSSSWLPPAVGCLRAHDRRRVVKLVEKQTKNLHLADHQIVYKLFSTLNVW